MHYILESTFARIFLFLELTLQQETHIYINLHQFAQFACIVFAFLSSLDNDFILIGHFKQCVQCRTTRGVLKIERYGQRLTHRACMGETSSYSWAPDRAIALWRDEMSDEKHEEIHTLSSNGF